MFIILTHIKKPFLSWLVKKGHTLKFWSIKMANFLPARSNICGSARVTLAPGLPSLLVVVVPE